jgi:hypothetical protein
MKDQFIRAIRERRKIQITFDSKTDGPQTTRNCAPLDFGPSRTSHEQNDRYHLWNYEGDTKPHVMALNPYRVTRIVLLQERFEPSEFVTWSTITSPWFVTRDWGKYS